LKYRAEIDGLRAITIVPVILFHAGFELFRGGFVGVDVFFVTSGYLITTILIEDIENNRFSIIKFYERRARRILPALFFVIICCIPFAWMWMLPNQMKDFSQSLVAVSLFTSNIHFWREGGYFAALEEKPLLHTWSLAVEEQYYLLFPIFLILAWRFGRSRVFWMIAAFAAISLVLSEWGWRNQATANFYFAPTRTWELLAGSIAAFIVQKRGVFNNNLFSSIGLIAVLTSIFVYDRTTPFPSLYGLLPAGGAVLIILFAGSKTIIAKVLSYRLFVGIGLISYSAYLWHQPLFSFARIRSLEEPSVKLMFLLIVISMCLAMLSWRFVERPFRNKELISARLVAQISLFTASLIISIGWYGHITNGFEDAMLANKFNQELSKKYKSIQTSIDYDIYDFMFESDCKIWSRNSNMLDRAQLAKCREKYGKAVVVLGDSHAMNLYNILAKSKKTKFLIGLAQGGCRPHNNHSMCHYEAFDSFLQTERDSISKIIFHQSGSYFVFDENGNVDSQFAFEGSFGGFKAEHIDKVQSYLSNLHKRFDIGIIWLGPFLEYPYKPLDMMHYDDQNQVNPVSIKIFQDLDDFISDRTKDQTAFDFVKFSEIFDQPKMAFVNKCLVFHDTDHYSKCGEDILAQSIKVSRVLD
jgi:peptidoglycan/LPS O-acetylase OafA/YrhL